MMEMFDDIESALQFTVTTLIPKGHSYIVNIIGPDEAAANRASTIQIVSQHMVYEDGNCGLTLHLPFDAASSEFAHLVEFMGSSFSEFCDEYTYDDIPCFALRFGTDVEVTKKAIMFLLREVWGYAESTSFRCVVYDEGKIE